MKLEDLVIKIYFISNICNGADVQDKVSTQCDVQTLCLKSVYMRAFPNFIFT